MWRFFSKLSMITGVIILIGALLFLREYAIGLSMSGEFLTFLTYFLVQLTLALTLYFLGDHIGQLLRTEMTVKNTLEKYNKYSGGERK